MATTPVWPTFDLAEIAQEAAERAGIEFRSGYALRSARRSLELLSIEWANRGLNLWTIEGPTLVPLVEGQERYDLPDDTVDLIEHSVRTYGGTDYTEIPLDRVTLSEYSSIPNKASEGRPVLINIRREIHPYFCLWMVPPASPYYEIVYWRLRRMAPLGQGGVGMPEIPWRFVNAMIAGLAFHLALKSKDAVALQKVPLLKDAYEEQFQLASDEDRDRAAFRFVPGGYENV